MESRDVVFLVCMIALMICNLIQSILIVVMDHAKRTARYDSVGTEPELPKSRDPVRELPTERMVEKPRDHEPTAIAPHLTTPPKPQGGFGTVKRPKPQDQ